MSTKNSKYGINLIDFHKINSKYFENEEVKPTEVKNDATAPTKT